MPLPGHGRQAPPRAGPRADGCLSACAAGRPDDFDGDLIVHHGKAEAVEFGAVSLEDVRATAGRAAPDFSQELAQEIEGLRDAVARAAQQHLLTQDRLFADFLDRLGDAEAPGADAAAAAAAGAGGPFPWLLAGSHDKDAAAADGQRPRPAAASAPVSPASPASPREGSRSEGGPFQRSVTVTSEASDVRGSMTTNFHDENAAPPGDFKDNHQAARLRKTSTTESLGWLDIRYGENRSNFNLDRCIPQRQTLADKIEKIKTDNDDRISSRLALKGVDKLVDGLRWLESIREPERNGCLARLVKSSGFNLVCILLIFLNACFIVYTTNYEMSNLGQPPTTAMMVGELFFVCFYAIELGMKMAVSRGYFFWCEDWRWNLFDLFLVVFSVFEVVLYLVVGGGGKNDAAVNVSFLRSVRVFKIAKVLRIFRTLRFFTELRLMMDCVLGSFLSLFWCMVLLLFVLYVFSLLIVQALAADLSTREDRGADDLMIMSYFGSVQKAVITLFQSTTSGIDWRLPYNELVPRKPILGILPLHFCFLFYIIFFVIAAWNIVTSTFVEKALKYAKPDVESMMMDQNMKDIVDGEELASLFSQVDTDGSSGISLEEFRMVSEHPKFRSFLQVRGIDINNAELLYEMLIQMSGGEELDFRTCVNACLRMKGLASSIDLHSLSFETKLLARRQRSIAKDLKTRLRCIEDCVMSVLRAANIPLPPGCEKLLAGPDLASSQGPDNRRSFMSTASSVDY